VLSTELSIFFKVLTLLTTTHNPISVLLMN
jgi:hypothetical protein